MMQVFELWGQEIALDLPEWEVRLAEAQKTIRSNADLRWKLHRFYVDGCTGQWGWAGGVEKKNEKRFFSILRKKGIWAALEDENLSKALFDERHEEPGAYPVSYFLVIRSNSFFFDLGEIREDGIDPTETLKSYSSSIKEYCC